MYNKLPEINSPEDVRKYIKSQIDQWQIVPTLALLAERDLMGTPSLQKIYRCNVWQINSRTLEGSEPVYVDCKTGELVQEVSPECYRPASQDQIEPLVQDPESLDASRAKKHLEDLAKVEPTCLMSVAISLSKSR